VEVATTDETFSAFEVALAEAIIVASGGVCVSQDLADGGDRCRTRLDRKLAYRITGLQYTIDDPLIAIVRRLIVQTGDLGAATLD
jgi:hypothetical protein